MALPIHEEVDDGYTRQSFEQGDEQHDDRENESGGEALGEYEDVVAAVQAYNDELNRLEIPPNGDDYNELLRLVFNPGSRSLPKEGGR